MSGFRLRSTLFVLLISLQFVITWASLRSERIQGWVKAQPSLLYHRGEFLRGALRAERVTEEEVRAAVRAQGMADMSEVGAVVLETDGSFSVLRSASGEVGSALEGVANRPQAQQRPAA